MIKNIIIQTGIQVNIKYDQLYHIIIDIDKIMELFNNGFTNAIKHKNQEPLEIIINKLSKNKVLTQIINFIDNDLDINFDELFIPFYIKNATDKNIWKPIVDIILSKNKDLIQKINPYLHNSKIKYQEIIPGSNTIYTQFPSTGLGLSISKMISHVLGGDCGIYYQSSKKKVIFWFVFSYQETSVSEDI